jgi:L-threonylcarbamoyladenylate synthase
MASPDEIAAAVSALRAGQVVGLPTETVYGLAADASNRDAVRRIFAIKGRPSSHPVIVHIAGLDQVPRWAREFPPAARSLAERFWPGPLTIVLPRADAVPLEVTGGQDTVALRVPSHPLALTILRAFDGGLAAPSANRYGRVSPTTADHVREDLGDDVPLVLDGGPSHVGLESTIVACLGGQVTMLRPGRIGIAAIEAVVGPLAAATASAPRVPGSVVSHYAPRARVELVPPADVLEAVTAHNRQGLQVAVLAARDAAAPSTASNQQQPASHRAGVTSWIVAASDADTYARELYAHLRVLDGSRADVIVVARPPDGPEWHAVHDRLTRASSKYP